MKVQSWPQPGEFSIDELDCHFPLSMAERAHGQKLSRVAWRTICSTQWDVEMSDTAIALVDGLVEQLPSVASSATAVQALGKSLANAVSTRSTGGLPRWVRSPGSPRASSPGDQVVDLAGRDTVDVGLHQGPDASAP
jgi:hypothetical protein